jgi:2,4-dienoyl-CoA reductase-like NADH-dependent reductase (Old Yellow Enzyme family)
MKKELFEEVRLGPKVSKNRFVRSATNDHLSDPDGMLTEEQLDLYEELAWNDVGVIITGHFGVSERYKTAFNQPLMSDDRFIPRAKVMADTAYYYGSLLYGQLSHGGLKAWKEPFDINKATKEELAEAAGQFASAAGRLAKAGFDGVQVHLAHGYLLSNVLDDTVNHRSDEYGGSDENRFRLVREVIEAIKGTCPEDFGILVKMNANDEGCLAGGHNDGASGRYDSHLISYAKMLEACGVDGIELSGADFFCRSSKDRKYFLREAGLVKAAVNIPVILVGGIASLSDMEEVLDRGIDMVSMCRPFITEPDLIPKLRDGKQDASRCLHCNSCFRIHVDKYKNCVFLPESEKLEELYGK